MKKALFTLIAAVALLGAFTFAQAAEKHAHAKAQTLTGTLTCAKCGLKEAEKCQNVLSVKDGDKTVNYYIQDNAVSKKNHKAVCHGPKDNVTVTGVVKEEGGKHIIIASKIEGA